MLPTRQDMSFARQMRIVQINKPKHIIPDRYVRPSFPIIEPYRRTYFYTTTISNRMVKVMYVGNRWILSCHEGNVNYARKGVK